MSSVPLDFAAAYPNSRKVHVTGSRDGVPIAVPMREIALSGGEPPLSVYDTSGPQGFEVRDGLPPLRASWIARRGGVVEVPGAVPAWSSGQGDGRPRREPSCAARDRSPSCTTRGRAS